ncbi:Hypothetical predicted protein [Xyrichtys novacula]|uniref:Kv channel-interacting protein 4 n=1 Tax=Xyrichtys novacula TaxID=13765 RepID=A0AAV1HJR3_XYRNO|nr:Hypothetical predicted protein [Xyrichtys novacula]
MRVQIQNSTQARMFLLPLLFLSVLPPLAGTSIKGSLDRQLGFFHVRHSSSLSFYSLYFVLPDHSRVGVRLCVCVRSSRTSKSLSRGIMGALMVIFSLQPKQRRKMTDSVEDELELSAVRHRPEGLEQLEAQTRFSRKELQILYRGFKNECPSGVVNEETFKDIYAQFFPQGDASTYAHFLFNAFDTDHNGSVSFEDFVMGLSILLRGTIQEKLNWAFNLYDINKDGYITKEEMLDIMKAIYDMMGKCTYPVLKEETPRQHVEVFFQKMDKNKDGVVTIDEFIDCCQNDENIMRSMHLFENVL